MKLGQFNELRVARDSDYGLYLADEADAEVLLPRRYVTDAMRPGTTVRVFVYRDSEDRPVATTETPYATVGQFAFMQVSDVNSTGAFLDWGLAGKQLLVPFSEQRVRMVRGGIYPVYVYLDHATGRVVASAKIDHFLGNVPPDYRPRQRVQCLVTEHTPIGYRVVVDNLHRGMIYANETYTPPEVGQTVTAYVKHVRPDGKIDLIMAGPTVDRTASLAGRIAEAARAAGGRLALGDSSSPDDIRAAFSCSKKDFKRALGHLYKEGRALPGPTSVTLTSPAAAR